jgi:hypothetical protein
MTGAYDDLRAVEVPIRRACTLIGRSRATHYRHLRGPVEGPSKPRTVPDNGQALSATERARVLGVIGESPILSPSEFRVKFRVGLFGSRFS